MTKKRILIDSDPALGVKYRDVDDGLAILLMIASPEILIEGITINYGNAKAPLGYKMAKKLLKKVNSDIPVFKGADSKKDLGKVTPAVEFLINTVNKNPGEISLLTLAPLTNVATAMMVDSDFASNLGDLVIMGGALNFKFFSYFGEFNFHMDGKATSIVMSAPIKKTLITMDVCSQAVFKMEHLKRFQQNTSDMSQYLAKQIMPWLKINKTIFFRKKGFFPWDAVAAAYFIDDSLFDRAPYTMSINEKGIRSGHIYNLMRCSDFDVKDGIIPVNMPLKLEKERFMDLFIDSLLTF